jgi:hypothetical protein
MTPAELLQFTFVRFKLSVLSLMLMISLFLFYNVFHHTISLVALVYALIYIVVLNVGMRGASTRSVGMLRFYWVFQFVQLIVFLVTAAAVAGFITYTHVVAYQQMQHAQNENFMALHSQTMTIGNQKIDPNTEVQAELQEKKILVQNVVQTTSAPKPTYTCSFTNALYVLIPALVSLIVIFSITRSIVLARQLISLLENNADLAVAELNACCRDEECCQDAEEAAPVSQELALAPAAVYIAPQGFVPENIVYPGQLMPVYVDKFGQPLH